MNEQKRKNRILVFSTGFIFLCAVCISALWIHSCQQIAFEHISAFCEILIESDPKAEPQLLSALKKYHFLTEQEINGNSFLSQYGYRIDTFCKGLQFDIPVLAFLLSFVLSCIVCFSAKNNDNRNRKRIAQLTDYLEQINLGIDGTVIQTQEDDFSHLQDEIYKTVTMLYQTKEAAVTAQKRFAENLENIAHQLKTPITAAFLSLQLMKKTAPGDHAKQIEKQLKRLNRLEESLLTLSKIDAGTLALNNTSVDIYTALNLAAENLNDLLQKENIFVDIPDQGCIEFSGDLEWTMEALINLLKNCMEHSQPGGSIHCDYTENPLYAEILIWDEGEGFDPDDIPHLFERFYRGKRAAGSGIGIGLALARSVFELQNGTISARNLEGGGACFEVRVYRH